MLLQSHKALFIHIPRTGGTSVEGYFRTKVIKKEPDEIYGKNCSPGNEIYHLNGRQHYPLKFFERYEGIEEYYKFTFARHPFDRLISAYEYSFKKKYSFNFFMKIILRLYLFKNDFSANYTTHLKPQYRFLESNTLKMDFIGRLENIENDFYQIQETLGLPRKKIPHHFKTKRKPYKDYFDHKTSTIAEKIYKKDFELLGYSI